MEQTKKLLCAFPDLSNEFVNVLIERAKDKGFNDVRFTDAINNVVDNCQYPKPTLANFLSYDKRIKIYSYSEMCRKVSAKECSFDEYTRIEIEGGKYWISKKDKALYL